jgi:hypothetical protein
MIDGVVGGCKDARQESNTKSFSIADLHIPQFLGFRVSFW